MSVESAATEGVAIDVRMVVTASKEPGARVFRVALVRCEHRYWDDDPEPDVIETRIAETTFSCSLPALFDAVDSWLREGYQLRALPHSWQVSASDAPVGCEVLLVADALPTISSGDAYDVGAGSTGSK